MDLTEVNTVRGQHRQRSTQSEDIQFKMIKGNADFFANFILQNFNKYIIDGKFPDQLKRADVSPVFEKEAIMIKPIIDRGVSCPRFKKFLSVSFIIR